MRLIAAVLFFALMGAGLARSEEAELQDGVVTCDEKHCAMTKRHFERLKSEVIVQYMASQYMGKMVETLQAKVERLEDERKQRCAAKLEVVPNKRA